MSDSVGSYWAGIGSLWTAGCSLLFPPQCLYCGGELREQVADGGKSPFCGACLAGFGALDWHACPRCGHELPQDGGSDADGCSNCKGRRLRFDTVVALGRYHGGLREGVLRMKRPAHDALSLGLGRLLAERRREHLAAFHADLIVPVPMFWRRHLGRGKNSPEVLAGCLANSLRIPMRRSLLVRCRNTLPQSGLAPSRRLTNVRGAFRVRRPAAVRNARVLLVDDVLTTGATCNEAAKMLKQAGATAVAVAVVARA
ncbi:MAG: ComF family protein [Planctomycetaceae bacterium]|nr:ComF family protein [Planctomycetaceae bacterium]